MFEIGVDMSRVFLLLIIFTFIAVCLFADGQIYLNGTADEDLAQCEVISLSSAYDPLTPGSANEYQLLSTVGSPWDTDGIATQDFSNGDEIFFLFDGIVSCTAPGGGVTKGDTIYAKHSDSTLSTSSASAEPVGEAVTTAAAGDSFDLYFHPASMGGGGGGTPSALLDGGSQHTDTTNSAVTAGDLIFGNGTPLWDDLAIGSSNRALTVTSGLPAWDGITCPSDDETPIGDGSAPPVCTAIPDCTGENVLQYDASTNSYVCTDIDDIVSDSGGGTPFDFSRHLMFHQPSATSGDLISVGWGTGLGGVGTARASPTTINAHVAVRECGTATNSICGWSLNNNANNAGVLRHRYDIIWKLRHTTSNGTDDNRIRFTAGFGEVSEAGAIPISGLTCSSAGGTDNIGGVWMCFEKSNQANWMACSGDDADWDCDDTGDAAPSSGDIFTIEIDTKDMANVKYYLNGVLTYTRTTLLPSSTSAEPVDLAQTLKVTNTVTLVQMQTAFVKATWD